MFIRKKKYEELKNKLDRREADVRVFLFAVSQLASGAITPEDFSNLTQGVSSFYNPTDPRNDWLRAYRLWEKAGGKSDGSVE